MNKRAIIASILILITWGVLAQVVNNAILLPTPIQVSKVMSTQVGQALFYQHLYATLSTTTIAVLLAVVSSLVLGIWCGLYPKVYQWISPALMLIKTVPNISFIIFLLIWLSSKISLVVIVFLIIFPNLFENVVFHIRAIEQDQKDVIRLYSDTPTNLIKVVYIPSIYLPFISATQTSFTLGLKVTVMAELIGQAKMGIGSMMNLDRILLNMDSLFAWTIWIIILGFMIDTILSIHAKIMKHRLEN